VAVVASFYSLQFATEQIGGGHVAVTNLTKPGAEPHDIELTPQDVANVSKAKMVVYQKGLQGAVDKAVESQGGRALRLERITSK
jgi:zinc transport system substrate-binding protein